MRKFIVWCLPLLISALVTSWGGFATPSAAEGVVYQLLPKPGAKVTMDADHYYTYGFDKQPKLGATVMRVEIFNRNGKRDTTFVVKGSADMPSMRGAHSSGDTDFSLSTKGVYLLPVQLVMPGDWEIRFTFIKSGKTLHRGSYRFNL